MHGISKLTLTVSVCSHKQFPIGKSPWQYVAVRWGPFVIVIYSPTRTCLRGG